MEQKKIAKFNKIFPWYAGLSGDLLFYVAIDTLFLTVAKNLTASQIVSLTTISLILGIIMQVPLLGIIKKIGNTNSVRVSSLLLLISSLLITFGQTYIIIVIGYIFYEISFTFQNMSNIVLKNNLELQSKGDEYIKIKTKSNTIYAVVTAVISFIASVMFNINNYLPMLGCIACCLICLILSFYIVDYSSYNNPTKMPNTNMHQKIKYSYLIILLIISYSLFYPIVSSGQSNGKLFIQQELLLNFNVEKATLILGTIICISRIIRVISNITFNKIYDKYNEKVVIILSVLLSISLMAMMLGSFIHNSIIIKFGVMSIGYIIILFIRDPFKVYIQDLVLKKVGREKHQSLLTMMELARKIIRAILSLSFTMILLNRPMIVVIIILFILSLIEIFISIMLYKIIIHNKDAECEEKC